MKQSEMIWIASCAVAKSLTYDELQYSDYMYGHEMLTDEVWEYVTECQDEGKKAFYEKYKHFKLF